MRISGMLFLLGAMTFFMACKKSDDSPKIEEPIANPTLSSISPSNGSKTTPVTFNGSDFGSDASEVTVFFNDVEAVVQSVADDKIVALVPARAFTGAVKVVIDGTTLNGPLFTYTISEVLVTTLAGNGTGSFDMISGPWGLDLDVEGNIYVTEFFNFKIKKITPTGEVTLFAGNGENDPFTSPSDIALDAQGNAYVADFGGHKIRKITPSGVVSLFAGSTPGFNNANGASAMFDSPEGVAVDMQGNVYVADSGNHKIRKITPSGDVTTLAGATLTGSAGGFTNGAALTVAEFDGPVGVVLDAQGNMYVADGGNKRIRKITPSGNVTTFAGDTTGFFSNGTGDPVFSFPNDLALDIDGNVYVADTNNHSIRKITPNGEVSTLAGSTDGTEGDMEGAGVNARFNLPLGIAVDVERNIYVSDAGNNKIRIITQE